jgi:uncharacterized membrane protein
MELNPNRTQRVILIVTALLLLVLLLYPPWCEIKISHGGKLQSIGNHAWFLNAPKPSTVYLTTAIDTGLLAEQVLIILGIMALILVACHGWTRRRET